MSDRAAALTYYAAMSIFPGAIALVALLKLVGTEGTVTQLLKGLAAITAGGVSDTLSRSVEDIVQHSEGAGIALVLSLAAALWTASGYVGALLRAHNVVARAEEKRPWWRLRLTQLGVTAGLIVALSLALVVILASGPLAKAAGAAVGVEGAAVDAWTIVKWPALLLVGVAMTGLIRRLAAGDRGGQRIVSWGGVTGALIWVAASAGFALYVSKFGSYDQTYGSLTAAIVFLVWLWLSNAALLFGAELDAELDSPLVKAPPVSAPE